jgi:hypothetical protein
VRWLHSPCSFPFAAPRRCKRRQGLGSNLQQRITVHGTEPVDYWTGFGIEPAVLGNGFSHFLAAISRKRKMLWLIETRRTV